MKRLLRVFILGGLSLHVLITHAQVLGDSTSRIYGMAIQASSSKLGLLRNEKSVELWNYHTKQLIRKWDEVERTAAIEWAPQWMAVALKSGEVKIFDAETLEMKSVKTASKSALTHLKFLHDNLLAVSDYGGNIYLIDASGSNPSVTTIVAAEKFITDLDYVPESDQIVASTDKGRIISWSLKNGQEIYNRKITNRYIFDIQYREDVKQLFVGTANGRVLSISSANGTFASNENTIMSTGRWVTCVNSSSDLCAAGSIKKVNVFTKNGIYTYKTSTITNFVYLIPELLPNVVVIVGTHGSGLKIIEADQMKVINK